MGCFAILRGKKKKDELPWSNKSLSVKEHMGAALPEPEICGRSLQSAPPSFRNRAKAVLPASGPVYGRARALSAPSSLIVTDHDVSSSTEFDEQEESKIRCEVAKEQRFSNPLPLPLPSPRGTSMLKNLGSFKSNNGGSPVLSPRTLPLPPLGGGSLRNFNYEEIAAACQNFSADRCVSEGISSTVYKATFGDDSVGSKKLEATVIRLMSSSLNFKDFVNTLNTIASLQHPHLCRLLGFNAREGSDQRMLVFEKLYHGSLDRLLFGRSDGPTMDWSARMNIALSAARGLAFLHEEGPFQAMFHEFSSANIQVEKDFSAKLSGYGGVSYSPETEINTSVATASLSVETLEKGLLTPKSNVWSFGIVLLELLTGRRNFDCRHPKEERNIVKWCKPFLADDCRLPLIMDPRIKARCPPQAARTVADLAVKCLHKDPSERPTMRTIVEVLSNVRDIRCPCRYRLQEPSTVARKQMSKSSSLNGIAIPAPPMHFSPSPSPSPLPSPLPSPSMSRALVSPRSSLAASLPSVTCSSMLMLEEDKMCSVRKLASTTLRRPGVEGF